jgi:hypothetical protein
VLHGSWAFRRVSSFSKILIYFWAFGHYVSIVDKIVAIFLVGGVGVFLQVASIMLVSILRMSFMNHVVFILKKIVKNLSIFKNSTISNC